MSSNAQLSDPGLTIGDLARRTGLNPATLRAWESRHGFPRPHRLSSGHRRYDETDVGLVEQVLRRRDAGVRLEIAIAEAASVRGAPTISIFAEMRGRHPHLTPQRLRKSTLLALTWAMEDECCARAQRPTLFAAFQHERYYRAAQSRWDELTRTSRRAVVFASFEDGTGSTSPRGATLVHLPDEIPMRREWSLVCDAVDHPAALAAWELPGQEEVADGDRIFESLWTLEPPAVRDAARSCARMAEQLAPEQARSFDQLDGTPAAASADLRSAERMFSRLVAYVDRAQSKRP